MTHAQLAGDWQMQSRILGYLARAVMTGPRPAAEGIERSPRYSSAPATMSSSGRHRDDAGNPRGDAGPFRRRALIRRRRKRRLEAVGLTVTVAVPQMYWDGSS